MTNREPHVVKEISPGVYWALLDFPDLSLAAELLDRDVPLVLCWAHQTGDFTWQRFQLPLVAPASPQEVLSRGATFDFVLPTQEFQLLVPRLRHHLNIVQLRSAPPDWLDMSQVRGPSLYEVLGSCGWHLALEIPGNDYGQVSSPSRAVVERAIALVEAAA